MTLKPKLTRERVRGTPIEVGGRVLVPEAQVTSLVAHEVTFASRETRLAGMQTVRVRPTALIEQTLDGERRHSIEDKTSRILTTMMIGAAALPLILGAVAARLANARG